MYEREACNCKKMRDNRKEYGTGRFYKLCSKCYYTYVLECIIKGKNQYSVTFKGQYIHGFSRRVKDWCQYVLDNIYKFYLVHVTPNADKTFKGYELIHYKVRKPIHPKMADIPDEFLLEQYLRQNGFKVANEHLYSTYTVYDVVRA